MALIDDLRRLTGAGTTEYTIDGTAYFADEQLQAILDANQRRHHRTRLLLLDEADGTITTARLPLAGTLIAGTEGTDTVGVIRDRLGTELTGWEITGDGHVTFDSDVAARRPVEWTGVTYDLNAAATDVLDAWASAVKTGYDIQWQGAGESARGQFNRSQIYAQLVERADSFRARQLADVVELGGGW